VVGCWRGCLEQGADVHMAQLMPLPLAVSCSSKIQIGFSFLVPAHPGSPGQRAVKRVCVCVLSYNFGNEIKHGFLIWHTLWQMDSETWYFTVAVQ